MTTPHAEAIQGEMIEINELLKDPEGAIDAAAVRADVWLDRNANHIDGMPHGNALSQLAMAVPIMRLLVLSQRKRREKAEIAALRADLQRITEELKEERMVRKAAEQAEMRYHKDCVQAEAALRVLREQLARLVAEWRETTAKNPATRHSNYIAGRAWELAADEVSTLIGSGTT